MKKYIPLLLFALLAISPVSDLCAQSKKDKIVMPEYPGGESELYKFLARELVYPDDAGSEVGEVLVGFSIGMDGSVSGVRVLKSVSPALDAEAVRVVKMMKYWKPGTRNGKPVRAEMSIPINFKTVIEHDKYVNENDRSSKNLKF